ncbi:methyltransferase domain-containing protein [Shewanella mesophila]|nr:methyltransferase domain-containing protein [Shewanella mesophila]
MASMTSQSYATAQSEAITAAVNAPERLERDKLRDPDRHPGEILAFYDIKPGQQVLDLFSGGGYYSELLSRVVGEEGSVLVHNNQAYLPYAKAELAERNYSDRFSNVEVLVSEADDLAFKENSFDSVFFILGFHDMFYHEADWPAIDRVRLVEHLYDSLKPGGLVAIIDHDAITGSGVETAHRLHRLAKVHVIELMQQAGFTLVDSLSLLENPQDPMTQSVFDKSVKGKTNRYVLKFKK